MDMNTTVYVVTKWNDEQAECEVKGVAATLKAGMLLAERGLGKEEAVADFWTSRVDGSSEILWTSDPERGWFGRFIVTPYEVM